MEALSGGESLEVETDWMADRLGPICLGKMAPAASLWRWTVSRGFPSSEGVLREEGGLGGASEPGVCKERSKYGQSRLSVG